MQAADPLSEVLGLEAFGSREAVLNFGILLMYNEVLGRLGSKSESESPVCFIYILIYM